MGLDLGENVPIDPVFCLEERGSDQIDSAAPVLLQLASPVPRNRSNQESRLSTRN